jgi:hypothetical protein
VSQKWGLTSCKSWGEVSGCGRFYIGRINCMDLPKLMDRIKLVVLSIRSIYHPNIRKGQAGITRKGCVKDLDPKVQ